PRAPSPPCDSRGVRRVRPGCEDAERDAERHGARTHAEPEARARMALGRAGDIADAGTSAAARAPHGYAPPPSGVGGFRRGAAPRRATLRAARSQAPRLLRVAGSRARRDRRQGDGAPRPAHRAGGDRHAQALKTVTQLALTSFAQYFIAANVNHPPIIDSHATGGPSHATDLHLVRWAPRRPPRLLRAPLPLHDRDGRPGRPRGRAGFLRDRVGS